MLDRLIGHADIAALIETLPVAKGTFQHQSQL